MNRTGYRLAMSLGVAFSLLLMFSVASAQPKGKSFPFHGKVAKVDAKAKTITVNGENVQGWMSAMTMTYSADKEDVVTKVKAGDEITATVYEGDFKTLYNVQVVPPKASDKK
jgi:Cu/Ag efflux protein CusF